jgi:hypothetical protein
MSEQTSICMTLAICYLMHNREPQKVRDCAKRIIAIEWNNVRFLQDLITLDNLDVQAIMNNILK